MKSHWGVPLSFFFFPLAETSGFPDYKIHCRLTMISLSVLQYAYTSYDEIIS